MLSVWRTVQTSTTSTVLETDSLSGPLMEGESFNCVNLLVEDSKLLLTLESKQLDRQKNSLVHQAARLAYLALQMALFGRLTQETSSGTEVLLAIKSRMVYTRLDKILSPVMMKWVVLSHLQMGNSMRFTLMILVLE